MQQFYPKILLNNFFYQKALILIALVKKIMKLHQNWKIALNLLPIAFWRYCPKLNMANCYFNCMDSYSIVIFWQYLQGKKCADIRSYITECIVVCFIWLSWIFRFRVAVYQRYRNVLEEKEWEGVGGVPMIFSFNLHPKTWNLGDNLAASINIKD